MTAKELVLHDDERAYLADSERCSKCDHLHALHNTHCCTFCTVEGCTCAD